MKEFVIRMMIFPSKVSISFRRVISDVLTQSDQPWG